MVSLSVLCILPLLQLAAAASLAERVADLDERSLELVARARMEKRLSRKIRSELISFFLDFVRLHEEVVEVGEPLLLFKVSRIAARLRAGLRVRLPHVKKRLNKVVAGLLSPLFFPWFFIDERRIPPQETFATNFINHPLSPFSNNVPPSNFVDMDYPQK